MARITGKNGRFRVGSTDIPAARFSVNVMGADADTTSGEDGGYETCVAGTARADISADLYWDSASTILNIVAPNSTYTISIYPVLASSSVLFTGAVFIKSAELVSDGHGKEATIVRVTGRTTGSFTIVGL
jgi:hypothetical protein